MKKILVLGGTRFFGKRLVEQLLQDGLHVTIATRGIVSDPWGDRVERIHLDREDPASLAKAVADGQQWDTVYDNICYSPLAAQMACDVFRGKVRRYILTSTLSVYDTSSRPAEEKDVNPYIYPYTLTGKEELSYAEGKRQAEAVFFQQADFPVAALRIPIVLGEDDYTGRLEFHIDHVKRGQPMLLPNLKANMCFISSAEVASILVWLRKQQVEGPVNARSAGDVTLGELMRWIEKATGERAQLVASGEAEASPFGVADSWTMDTGKAERLGYVFQPLRGWLPALIEQLAATERPSKV